MKIYTGNHPELVEHYKNGYPVAFYSPQFGEVLHVVSQKEDESGRDSVMRVSNPQYHFFVYFPEDVRCLRFESKKVKIELTCGLIITKNVSILDETNYISNHLR